MMPRLLRVFGLGAVLVAGGIGAAAAADVPPLPPPLPPPFPMPVVQVFSWTGFYIGGNAGWGWTNGSGTFTTALGADPSPSATTAFSAARSSATIGKRAPSCSAPKPTSKAPQQVVR
jgi:opacity protein-like surface antigen